MIADKPTKNKCEKIIVNKLITDKTPKARLTAFKDSQVLNSRPHEIMICEIKEIVGLSLFELDRSVAVFDDEIKCQI